MSPCVNCGKETRRVCSLCHVAPSYDEETLDPTYYCSNECVQAQMSQHKEMCQKIQQRKFLKRAAHLLKDTMILYRTTAYPLLLEVVSEEPGAVVLAHSSATPTGLLQAFDIDIANADTREGVLLSFACVLSMIVLSKLTEAIFEGTCYKVSEVIDEVTIIHKDSKLHITFPADPPGKIQHEIYRVIFPNNESWVIDVTGAQFGHPNPLCPWHVYAQNRTSNTRDWRCLGSAREEYTIPLHTDHIPASTLKRVNLRFQMEFDVAKALDGYISQWFHSTTNGPSIILGAPEEEYLQWKQVFLEGARVVYEAALKKTVRWEID
ncbi:hypothetical protein B0J14DRAFT_563597 [Halenospora varia]|nr:hypothetical protein B0J14DRAFT_563597 [Halenospora varia]